MAKYDPDIIHKFADNLYSQADRLMFLFTLSGALGGMCWGVALATTESSLVLMAAIFGAILGGLARFLVSSRLAFQLQVAGTARSMPCSD